MNRNQNAEAHLPHLEKRIAILIVEDQELMRRMLREYLRSAYPQADILEAADGAAGLEVCRRLSPHLVLMDIGLPDANGIDLTSRIKDMLPRTEVIVISQHAAEAYVERARAAGAFAYISKDKLYRELLPAVSRALGRDLHGSELGDPT